MTEYYFQKVSDGSKELILMFEAGEIRKPLALLFPDDIERLKKELKKEQKNQK